jgi:hypothetical protein
MDHPWRVKHHRADEHLRRFEDDCAAYAEAANVGLEYETDQVAGTIRVRLRADAEPWPSLGATVGDVLHNLRSALDAVAWEACQRAGSLAEKEEGRIYFPIDTNPAKWTDTAKDKLPGVTGDHLEVFRQLQPWFWDEEARAYGVAVVEPSADVHPLSRLHYLAKVDRHRVPHPVLARAGDTWLGTPEGVTVKAVPVNYWGAQPGDVLLEWRVHPPGRVLETDPAGEAILALSEEAALQRRTAPAELRSLQAAAVQATRRVEIEVLQVVTPNDIADMEQLRQAREEAQDALDALVVSVHVIDVDYIARHKALGADADAARAAHAARWRELFE